MLALDCIWCLFWGGGIRSDGRGCVRGPDRESEGNLGVEMGESRLGTVGALSLSVVSSVSIVICNKALISTLGFTFGKKAMVEPMRLWFVLGCF